MAYLADYLPADKVHLPPAPVKTRWRTWYECIVYHAEYLSYYEGFFRTEKSEGMAIDRILEILQNKERYTYVEVCMNFIVENCQRTMTFLTFVEGTRKPLCPLVYTRLEDLRAYLDAGITKGSFGTATDRSLAKLSVTKHRETIKVFHAVFTSAQAMFTKHIDVHPAMSIYKAARIFHPPQIPTLPSKDISDYEVVNIDGKSQEIMDEFLIYTNLPASEFQEVSVDELHQFWTSQKFRFAKLSSIAERIIWFPVASVDVERSFSRYKTMMTDKRTCMTEETTRQWVILMYNEDIEARFH